MEPLARWIRREWEGRTPIAWGLLGVLGTAQLYFAGVFGPENLFGKEIAGALGGFVGLTLLMVLAWIPVARVAWRNRHRPDMRPFVGAAVRGRLAEAVGPKAPRLNEAATDLEQIRILLHRQAMDSSLTKRLRRESENRMRRMFELTVAAPALHGLSREQADDQIEADARWLAESRRLLEANDPAKPPSIEADPLQDLQSTTAAREEAIRELLA